MSKTAERDAFCGILNVDKPLGITSHDVVTRVRRTARQHQVGHAGTLDPLATGVLLVCMGQATRVSPYLADSPKTYQATIRLGISTTTHDAEGEIVCQSPVKASQREVEAALRQFIGRIGQVPPMHSAIKQDGKTLYKLARRGITVERPPRKVDIYAIRVVEWLPDQVSIEVECGPGTYIRALARDVGEALGCGAHLAALRRTISGQFSVEQAATLEQLEAAFVNDTAGEWLHPLDAAFYGLPAIHLNAPDAQRLALGQSVADPGEANVGPRARAYGPALRFIALVSRRSDGSWKPQRVFVDPRDVPQAVE